MQEDYVSMGGGSLLTILPTKIVLLPRNTFSHYPNFSIPFSKEFIFRVETVGELAAERVTQRTAPKLDFCR